MCVRGQRLRSGRGISTAIEAITGRPASEATPEVIERTGTLVGRAIASATNFLDLDLVVIAGSVALGFDEPFFAAARAEISRRCTMEFSKGVVVQPAGLKDLGPLTGAAAVGWRGLGQLDLAAPRLGGGGLTL